MTYSALTVWQPWIWAITDLGKDVENRDWAPKAPPGPVVLHAGTRRDDGVVAALEELHGAPLPEDAFAHGLLALVDIDEIHHAQACRPRGYCSAWASRSGYHWRLRHPRPLEAPVPARGRQRLWRLSADQDAQVRRALAAPIPR